MPLSKKKQEEIEKLATESIEIIEAVASNATNKIREKAKDSGFSPFASVNTWTDNSEKNLSKIKKQNVDDLLILAKEPVIARIVALTMDEEEKVFYISRTSPASVEGINASFASYR